MDDRAYTVRPARPDELDEIVSLAGRALGWDPDAPNRTLFEWKHVENPFGRSPLWVAEERDRLIGFRALMRWEFVGPGGTRLRAVRPVDTATHPDHQGRGVFRALTEEAIADARAEGVDFVFNTPNEHSRPGYLKMGWRVAGRVPTALRPSSLATAARMVQARRPAEKWSEPVDIGADATKWFAEHPEAGPPTGTDGGLSTDRTEGYLRWRYGPAALNYRVLAEPDDPSSAVVFRVRRRGPATEAAVTEWWGAAASVTELLTRLRRSDGVDHLLAAGRRPPRFITVRGLGPVLTVRDLARPAPELSELDLRLGDIELF